MGAQHCESKSGKNSEVPKNRVEYAGSSVPLHTSHCFVAALKHALHLAEELSHHLTLKPET